MINKSISEYSPFISCEVTKQLHPPAFLGIMSKMEEFTEFNSISNRCSSRNQLSWVLNAPMGHGKTTALTAMMKMLGNKRGKAEAIPLLLVFTNTDTMRKVVDEVSEYGKKHHIPNLVTEVYEGNVSDVLERLSQFQFVCITQQRFRDLTLQ